MKDQPRPTDLLEELADKVIGQMDRLAVTSFETALDEMIDFHRFLIEAYETSDQTGKAVSFAQIGEWSAPHQDWIREYRRLFERAAQYIGRENDFIDILIRVPFRLLPRDGRKAAPDVTTGLLDLVNILVHRLEAWLTRHRTYETAPAESQPAVSRFAGSDKQAYEEVVMRVVGAWEDTLRLVDHIYGWRRREIEPAEQWRRYSASWPFLARHLRNSAYLLAVSVWNEDGIGANYYSEMLLRWFDVLHHELEEDYHLTKTLLTPDLLEKEWVDALDSLAPMVREPSWDQPIPAGVFAVIIQNALADAVVVAAGVILAWFIEGRQDSDIAPRIVSRLLRDAVEDNGTYRLRRETGFRPLMLSLVRIHAAGPRYEREGYSYWLDSLVESLDSMSERRVVPGRVYSPSTRNGREDILMPWLACLLAFTPPGGDENATQAISRLTEREEAFAKGDRSLRDLLYDLRKARSGLAPENHEYLGRGALALQQNLQIEEQAATLASVLDSIIYAIEAQRAERLSSRPIDEAKLNTVRRQVEQALITDRGGIEIFEGFKIVVESGEFPNREYTVPQIEKGFLTYPEMAQEPVNLWEVVTTSVQNFAARHVWSHFSQRARRVIEVHDEVSYLAALMDEAQRILQAGQQPVLLVRSWSDPAWIREWFGWSGERPEGLRVTRKDDVQTGRYVGTVNDIDVYRVECQPNQSLLLRADFLRMVRYGTNIDGEVVDLAFVEGQGEEAGALVFHFSQETEWAEDKIVVLRYPSATVDEKSE